MRRGERIHVIGIAGSGAAGTAVLLHHAGAAVDGCDLEPESPYTAALDAAGIRHVAGHQPEHLSGVDRVAITPALHAAPHHVELDAAEASGTPVLTWQAMLGELMSESGSLRLAVAGTHGKSTTTALLGHLLASAGLDPTVEVGAVVRDWDASVRAGAGPFVVEADEFGESFLHYRPAMAIVTSAEMDHPDYFADTGAVLASFERFVRAMAADQRVGGRLLVCPPGAPGIEALLSRLDDWDGRIIGYGAGTDLVASDVVLSQRGSAFRLFEHPFETTLAGEHNVLNATAALVAARELGIGIERMADGLRSFGGVGRRMELIGEERGVTIYDDYAHHPTEVRAAIAAARQLIGHGRRLWTVFEPHMYSRTALLFDQFAGSFSGADEVVIADIFVSRDTASAMRATSAELLADAIERRSAVPAIATGDVEATTEYVADHLGDGDAVLVMGAGKSYRIARGLAMRLARQRAAS